MKMTTNFAKFLKRFFSKLDIAQYVTTISSTETGSSHIKSWVAKSGFICKPTLENATRQCTVGRITM